MSVWWEGDIEINHVELFFSHQGYEEQESIPRATLTNYYHTNGVAFNNRNVLSLPHSFVQKFEIMVHALQIF